MGKTKKLNYNNLRQSRRLFIVVCFVGFVIGMDNGGLQYALLKIAEEYSMSETAMGSLMTYQFGGLTIAAVAGGILADKLGKKRIAVSTSALFALSTFVCYLDFSIETESAAILGCGISFGALEVSVCAALSDAYDKKAGRYLLIMQGFLGLGSVFCPLMADFMINYMDLRWNEMFLACAILFLVALILLAGTEFEVREHAAEQVNADEGKISFKDVAIAGMIICALIYGCVETSTGSFIDTFYVTIIKDSSRSAITLSLFWAAIGISRLIAGTLYRYRAQIIFIAYLGGGILLEILGRIQGTGLTMIVIISIGMLIGPTLPTLVSMANERCPRDTGLTTSIVNAASGLGSSFGPLAVGLCSDLISLNIAFMMLGISAIAALAVFFLMVFRNS